MFMEAEFWVAVAFLVFVGIAWKLGAFNAVLAMLDKRAALIRSELEDARALREEAQRVLADYQKRRGEAEAEAQSIIEAARAEAERLAGEAETKLVDFVERRTKMADQKIAQAEAQATAEVRAAAADAALRASEELLRARAAAGEGLRFLEQGLKDVRAKLN